LASLIYTDTTKFEYLDFREREGGGGGRGREGEGMGGQGC